MFMFKGPHKASCEFWQYIGVVEGCQYCMHSIRARTSAKRPCHAAAPNRGNRAPTPTPWCPRLIGNIPTILAGLSIRPFPDRAEPKTCIYQCRFPDLPAQILSLTGHLSPSPVGGNKFSFTHSLLCISWWFFFLRWNLQFRLLDFVCKAAGFSGL